MDTATVANTIVEKMQYKVADLILLMMAAKRSQ